MERMIARVAVTLAAPIVAFAPWQANQAAAQARPDGSMGAVPTTRPIADAPAFVDDTEVWLTDALARLEVIPGLALAVVVGDEPVLVKGWGVANREKNLPSTAETVYYIASATKPYTALAAALLDARGQVELESSLARHLHGAEFPGELEPDQVKLRDLLTHTSGIDNEPIAGRLAYTGEHDPQTLWRLLEHSTPVEGAPIGTFKYSNVGYNIYGMILDRELGTPWQDVLRDQIFRPLGLERTTAYASVPHKRGWPLAAPYFGVHPDGIQRLYLEKQDNTMQSAGGMMTTAADLGRWLEFQLNEGAIDGRQMIDAAVVRATHEKLVEADGGRPPFGSQHYGLGWHHGTYRDRAVLHHSGAFPGFRALVSFAPAAGVGVGVLTNEGTVGSRFADIVGMWVYDWWFDVPEDERAAPGAVDQLAAMRAQLDAKLAADFESRARREWMLSRPLDAYTGTFVNDLWGTVEVSEQDGRLAVRTGNLRCVTTAYEKPETARIELVPGNGMVIAFEPQEGEVEQVRIDGDVYVRRQ